MTPERGQRPGLVADNERGTSVRAGGYSLTAVSSRSPLRGRASPACSTVVAVHAIFLTATLNEHGALDEQDIAAAEASGNREEATVCEQAVSQRRARAARSGRVPETSLSRVEQSLSRDDDTSVSNPPSAGTVEPGTSERGKAGEAEGGRRHISNTRPLPRRRTPIKHALAEFLWLPLLIVAGFLVFTAVMVPVELFTPMGPVQRGLGAYISQSAISSLLPAIATSLVTAASITFSLLLMAVQQAASRYSQVVFDQFLRRRTNQVAIGFFVGLALYCLSLILFVTSTQAVLSGVVALVLTVVALALLIMLIYAAIDQIRPSSVVWNIQTMALNARTYQLPLLARCRATPQLADAEIGTTLVHSRQIGYVVDIDAERLATGVSAVTGEVEYSAVSGDMEIELYARLGTHLVVGETVAEIRGGTQRERDHLAGAVLEAITLARMRDSATDPGYAVDQLGNMAWALGSTGTQDPEGALVAVRGLHSLLVQWGTDGAPAAADHGGPLPVVYRDGTVEKVIGSLISELIVTVESAQ